MISSPDSAILSQMNTWTPAYSFMASDLSLACRKARAADISSSRSQLSVRAAKSEVPSRWMAYSSVVMRICRRSSSSCMRSTMRACLTGFHDVVAAGGSYAANASRDTSWAPRWATRVAVVNIVSSSRVNDLSRDPSQTYTLADTSPTRWLVGWGT